jgi:hypothetical protein
MTFHSEPNKTRPFRGAGQCHEKNNIALRMPFDRMQNNDGMEDPGFVTATQPDKIVNPYEDPADAEAYESGYRSAIA